MTRSKMPDNYIGKEQAYIKHTILKTYLQHLFMIVGQRKETVINYVDCFAGPWQEENDKLSDTSIGVSLEQMAQCQQGLKENFGRVITFRVLYIGKDPVAFEKLQTFLLQQPYPGDFQAAMKELVKDDPVNNIDADVSRRTKKITKPDWPNKSDLWIEWH